MKTGGLHTWDNHDVSPSRADTGRSACKQVNAHSTAPIGNTARMVV